MNRGTTKTYQNFAKVNVDFTDVDDGESFYQKFCNVKKQLPTSEADNVTTTTDPPSATSESPVVYTAQPGCQSFATHKTTLQDTTSIAHPAIK